MKTISATILSLLITVTHSLASGSAADGEGLSLMATFFIAFGVLIVLFQLVPGLMLFVGMVKGLFSSSAKKSDEVLADAAGKRS